MLPTPRPFFEREKVGRAIILSCRRLTGAALAGNFSAVHCPHRLQRVFLLSWYTTRWHGMRKLADGTRFLLWTRRPNDLGRVGLPFLACHQSHHSHFPLTKNRYVPQLQPVHVCPQKLLHCIEGVNPFEFPRVHFAESCLFFQNCLILLFHRSNKTSYENSTRENRFK